MEVKGEAEYDFKRIARAYFAIGRSYEFWESYVALLGLEARHFVYEDLLGDPMPFLEHIAEAMGAPKPDRVEASTRMLRDDETEVWRARFLEDMKTRSFVEESWSSPPIPNPANILRFLRRQPPKPFAYSY